jgi:hypothetical protein
MQSAIASAAGILIASVVCAGQPTPPSYSHAELKKMIGEAHTAEQYKALAAYFGSQEMSYKQKAVEVKHEWQRHSMVSAALYEKYPRPIDSSKNRYEYFTYEAQQMNAQATRYEGLAASAAQ